MSTVIKPDGVEVTNATHWLEEMPALKLTRGVLVRAWEPATETWEAAVVVSEKGFGRWLLMQGVAAGYDHESSLRVDLDDPLGFGYAFRLLGEQCWTVMCDIVEETMLPMSYAGSSWDLTDAGEVLERHLNGETTEADKLWLARECVKLVARTQVPK